MAFRRRVTKGIDRPVKGHFGSSPEFEPEPTGAKKPPKLVKRRPLKSVVKIRP